MCSAVGISGLQAGEDVNCSALNAQAATQPSWRPAAAIGYAKEVSAH